MSTVYLQQFPSYSNHNCKKAPFLRTPAFIFCLPWGRPCGNHAKRCMNEKTIQCLPNPSQHMCPSIFNSFPVIRTASAKKSLFHVPQPTCLFPLEMPLRLSRNMLHGCKDNSMLAKYLAACTHLSSTVSQLFEPQVQKIAVFTYRSPHFCFPWRRPCDYHAMCGMDGKTIQCLGGSRRNSATPFSMKKTRMAWLPDGEKISKISLFVLTELTNVTDRQTDGRTDRHRVPAYTALMHRIAR